MELDLDGLRQNTPEDLLKLIREKKTNPDIDPRVELCSERAPHPSGRIYLSM